MYVRGRFTVHYMALLNDKYGYHAMNPDIIKLIQQKHEKTNEGE